MIISVLVMSGCSEKDNSINEEIMQSQTNNDNNPFIGDSLTDKLLVINPLKNHYQIIEIKEKVR